MTLMELRKRPHWSFSSLNSLLNICSLQWKFQKIDKLKPTHTSVNLVAGSVYHRTLDQVFMARKLEMPCTVDEAQELYTQDWRRTSREENIKYGKLDSVGVEEQGRGLIEVAFNSIDPQERVIEVGEVFCVPVTHQGKFLTKPLVGEFDLVVEKNSKPLVIDWKTSATPSHASASCSVWKILISNATRFWSAFTQSSKIAPVRPSFTTTAV